MCIAPINRSTVSNLANLNREFIKAEFAPISSSSGTRKRSATKHHITVVHSYHDHAADVLLQRKHIPARGGVTTPFPLKLHAMLDAVHRDGLEHIVSWQPHGRCFVVHDNKEFVNILEKYFNASKIPSFLRQLNLYGFQRITKGRDKGAYYHELFLRGKDFLAHDIHRIKVKGTKVRARSNPEQEPNFYAMPFVSEYIAPQPEINEKVLSDNLTSLFEIPQSFWDMPSPVKPERTSLEPIPLSMWNEEEEEGEIAVEEAETFFKDFVFPSDEAFENIEDDDVFVNLLEEQMMAC